MIPLPNPPSGRKRLNEPSGGANAGLVYNKFVDCWERDGSTMTLGKNKANWIARFSRPVGQAAEIRRAATIMERLVEAQGGRTAEIVTASPFVTGMGLSHPVENGFLWHHTLGTPYLPGSSLKGLVRHWVSYWADTEGDNADPDAPRVKAAAEVRRLFGPPAGETLAQGTLIVFDALPLAPVPLMAEVMTPHDDGWRLDTSGTKTPSDWVSPNPIPFLAVAPGARFLLSVAPTRSGTAADVDQAIDWFAEALDWLGAGAKTSSGFGRFEFPEREAARAAEREQSRPPQVGDRVRIRDDYGDLKWRGVTGELVKMGNPEWTTFTADKIPKPPKNTLPLKIADLPLSVDRLPPGK